jgi:hypothetical protein
MVKVTVSFLCNFNATPVVKFRMWDVCVKAKSTKLCKHSDESLRGFRRLHLVRRWGRDTSIQQLPAGAA